MKRVLTIIFIALLLLIPLIISNPYHIHVLILIALNVMFAASLRLSSLRIGQLNFGHAAFIGIGAYTSALLVMRGNLSFWLAFPLAGVAAGIFAILLGYPSLRLRGMYFAIVTFAFGEILRAIYMKFRDQFGGPLGISNIPVPDSIPLGLITISFDSRISFYYLALLLAIVTILFLYRFDKSHFGLIFTGIREADDLAESAGINIMRHKVLAFTIGSFLAGMGGSFYAHYFTFISSDVFTVWMSIYILSYVVVGGASTLLGVSIGAIFLMLATELLHATATYKAIIYSSIMVLVIIFLPDGLVSLPRVIFPRLRAAWRMVWPEKKP